MNNHWQDITDNHRDGWYWCEALNDDAPPQLLRSYVASTTVSYAVLQFWTAMPRLWERWTTGGWVPLVGRVCPISPRPQ